MTRTLHLFRGHATTPPSLVARALSRHARWALPCLVLVFGFVCGARAEEPIGRDGLPGGRFVASASAPAARGAASATLEGAYTESVLGTNDRHQRVGGEIAAGGFVRRYLAIAGVATARYDRHQRPADEGFATSTRLVLRSGFDATPRTALAVSLAVDFPAAESLTRGLRATSPHGSLVLTQVLSQALSLSLEAGYRHDRSQETVADPAALSWPDLLAAQIASYDAATFGALLRGQFGKLVGYAEWSWEYMPVGGPAGGPLQMPMRVVLGLQSSVHEHVQLGGYLGATPSDRPAFDARYRRIEPRLFGGVSVAYRFGLPKPAPEPVVRAEKTTQVEVAPSQITLALRVVDAAGLPVPNARLSYERGGASQALSLDGEGTGSLSAPEGTVQPVTLSAEGFKTLTSTITFAGDSARTLVMERDLPPGEIKGKVRSLRGGPLSARIEVVEAGREVASGADGTFRIEVPPGSYTLRISASGHETQERTVQVEQLGVAILVIDLRRSL